MQGASEVQWLSPGKKRVLTLFFERRLYILHSSGGRLGVLLCVPSDGVICVKDIGGGDEEGCL